MLETEKNVGEKISEMNLSLEKETQNVFLDRQSIRIALLGIFTSLTVVLGYMLAMIPNIEVFTMMIFLSGFIMGRKEGTLIGFMSAFIFSFFNPFGPAPLPLFTVQLLYYSFVGFIGACACKYLSTKKFFTPQEDLYVFRVLLLFGLLGALLTFSFDIISSLVDAVWIFGTLDAFIPYYLSGIIFTSIHLVGNTLVFIFILPGCIQVIYKMLDIPTNDKS